jgi:hypothetical protein
MSLPTHPIHSIPGALSHPQSRIVRSSLTHPRCPSDPTPRLPDPTPSPPRRLPTSAPGLRPSPSPLPPHSPVFTKPPGFSTQISFSPLLSPPSIPLPMTSLAQRWAEESVPLDSLFVLPLSPATVVVGVAGGSEGSVEVYLPHWIYVLHSFLQWWIGGVYLRLLPIESSKLMPVPSDYLLIFP